MTGLLKPGPTIGPGDDQYERLAAAFAAYKQDPANNRVPGHPLANLLPMMPDNQRATLRASLLEGQNHPVTFHRGMILDGRNRARDLIELQKPILTVEFVGSDYEALQYVKAENIERRHLSESQRADFAARVAKLPVGANQHTKAAPNGAPSLFEGEDEPAPEALVSQSEAAEMFNVSRRSIQRATVYQERGVPELSVAVQSGKLAVSTAAEIAEALPAEEQKAVAALSEKEILDRAKTIRKEANEKRRAERVEKLKAQAEACSPIATARKFPVIYFDPATRFEAGDSNRSTENHYITMKEADIAALPIPDLATEDAVLFMWSTVPWLAKSIRLIEGWGFEYKSAAFWDKVDIGLGFWWRDQVEVLLVATRGKMVAPEHGSILGPNLYSEKKSAHSAKPLYFRNIIGNVPEYRELPKVELFARVDGEMPEGWFAWGAQANVPVQQSLIPEQADAD